MSQQPDLELSRIPQAAFDLAQGLVTALNRAASLLLPGLQVGDPVPVPLPEPGEGVHAGTFTWGQNSFTFHMVNHSHGARVLFSPAPQTALTAPQMEGFLQQMRQVQGDMLLEFQQLTRPLERRADTQTQYQLAAFRQSFYRLCRLNRNMEYLYRAQQGQLRLHPILVDLVAMCSRLAAEAGDLLSEGNVALTFRPGAPSLLVPGDPELLSTVILGLLSNAAKNASGGELMLRLLQRPNQAIILLRQGGSLSTRQLDELFNAGADMIPLPTQGAGMGLAVIQHIISLHGGALMWRPSSDGLLAAVCLPTGPAPRPAVSVRTPILNTAGGLSPVLLELCDVLPVSSFERASLD